MGRVQTFEAGTAPTPAGAAEDEARPARGPARTGAGVRAAADRRDTDWPGDEDLLFPSLTGTPIQPNNLRRRTLRPLVEEVEAAWAGFHTFRHTCASLLFERGANAKQVQRWLGHHSPSFTLDTYIHLLPDQLDAPLELDAELRTREVGTPWEPDPAEAHRNGVRRNPPIPLQKSRSPTETNCD